MGTVSAQPRFYDSSKTGRVLSQIPYDLSLFAGRPKSCDKSNESSGGKVGAEKEEDSLQGMCRLKRFLFQLHVMTL